MILGAVDLTVTRRSGAWSPSTGRYERGAAATFRVRGSIQPRPGRQTRPRPDGARAESEWVLLCDLDQTELRTENAREGAEADRVYWRGRHYVVDEVQPFPDHATGLPHFEYVLLEEGDDEVSGGP